MFNDISILAFSGPVITGRNAANQLVLSQFMRIR
jgi:hypothetical protein